ncbi:speckle-type POZ protein [Caerostris extrusa]|uniref:Speckle-type POZ protein n=1 Tax=Caerostris extrusa TaxID=172846 RepID=A0AAV4PGK5_CAEEX|nr:speckle-type POZ protein [Caerostris extrusa]
MRNFYSVHVLLPHEKIRQRKEEKSLSPVVLTVRCRIWKSDGSATETGRCFIRTRLKEDTTAFVAFVEKFSTSVTSRRSAILKVRSASLAKPSMSLILSLSEREGCQDDISLGIFPSQRETFFYCKCQLFVIEATGLKTECGVYETFPEGLKAELGWKIQLPLTKAYLMQRRTAFLPNDVLTFQCEFTFSTGIEFERVEKTEFGKSAATEREIALFPSVGEDLMSMQKDGVLSNTQLRTSTEAFPAHTVVLSARSPVFRAMFSSDMREKSNNCVDITDLEADTVCRLLLYVYSDTLENLDWESARNLYVAADKCDVNSLKHKCALYLKQNLQASNCCSVLEMADRHQDADMKRTVQDFMAVLEDDFLFSDDWIELEKKKIFPNWLQKLSALYF